MKTTKASDDKRFAPRRKRQIPGLLYIDSSPTGSRCKILDVSTTGARVQIEGSWNTAAHGKGCDGERIRLVDLAERVTYQCWIIRRQDNELGLRFAAPPLLPAAPARRAK